MKHLFRNRDTVAMLSGRTISVFGDAVLDVVLLLHVHDSGRGGFAIAALMACEALPLVLLMSVAGRIADRYDSRVVLLSATLAQGALCLSLLWATQLAALLIVVLLIQSAHAIAMATWSGLGPRLVRPEQLGHLISTVQGLGVGAQLAGTAIGPVLLSLAGVPGTVIVDAATFVALSGFVLAIRARRRVGRPAAKAPGLRVDLLRRDPRIWAFVLTMPIVVLFLVGSNVLDVFLVRDELHVPAAWFGLSTMAWGVGALVGAVVAARLPDDRARFAVLPTSLAGIGLLSVGTGAAPSFAVYLLCGAGIGVFNAVLNAAFGTVLMSGTPDEDRGKVSAAVNGITQTAALAGLPLGPALGNLLGVRGALVMMGAVTAALSAVLAARLAWSSRVREMADR
ncbi:MFS transporter [Branchiibius cervicis]|uniref:MFS transporter n=1 Tax=Branchiibius cervicis TaxID=908252 RepID=A0ABW2AYP6_9MICO